MPKTEIATITTMVMIGRRMAKSEMVMSPSVRRRGLRADAQRRWYELSPEPLREVDAWLAPYRRLWGAGLDALERHLDAMPDEMEEP